MGLTTLGKVIVGVIAAVILFLVLNFIYDAITAKAKAEARLGKNQTEAAQASGEDGVNTVAEAGERESASSDLTRTNEQEIRNAEGADAPVAAPVRDAGFASLCRRASYREHPKCLQQTNP